MNVLQLEKELWEAADLRPEASYGNLDNLPKGSPLGRRIER
jgi:hypothetical protein